ncbi:NHL repeat-containing protein [Candidatus Sumerlaeota bacterium]|nr:NHL repeat-containing protein [Candidatus Sumerlaeota bacterium]
MKNSKFKINILSLMISAFLLSFLPAREYYVTPDGETVYYSPAPRVYVYKPKGDQEKIYSVWVPHGKEPAQVQEPRDIYVDHKDRVYVTDAGDGMIKAFTPLGRLLRRIPVGSTLRKDMTPGAIAASPLGEIHVADTSGRNIRVFDITGRSLGSFSPPDEKDKFDFPEDLAATRNSTLLILDSEKSRVHRYSFRKEWIDSWGGLGDKSEEMNHPKGFALGKNGEVYIADTQNHRISLFWQNGKLIRIFGTKGESPGMLSFPHAISVDDNGLIAVVDRGGIRIQFFSILGNYLGMIRFGKEGSGENEIKADAIAFDGIGSLYIIDGLGKRVLKISSVQIDGALK